MKATSITISILCAILSFPLFAQIQNSGSNYTFNDFKKEPIIRYSSVDNKMYLLSEQFFTPGVFWLDTLNYDSQLWGNLSTSIVASDFIVLDNGELVFVTQNGTDIELFSTDSNGQLLWSEISTGITTGTISDLKLVKSDNGYWMYRGTDIYKFESNTWSQLLSPDPIHDFEVNSMDEPHVMTHYENYTPGFQGASHKVQFHDGANWQVRYDTTHYGKAWPLSQFCIDSNDSLYITYSYSDGGLWFPYVYLTQLQGNTLVSIDSMSSSTETVMRLDILLDLNENPHCIYSTMDLGPWSHIIHYYLENGNLIPVGDITLPSDSPLPNHPNHMAFPYSMAVDNYNCMHVGYEFRTDQFDFQGIDTINARVRKFCLCEYVNAQNSISQNGFELTADVGVNVNFQWLDCNDNYSVIAGATDSTYDASIGGSFALQIEQNGCVDTSECIAVSGLGINEFGLNSSVHFYPNPTTNEVKISITDNEEVLVEVRDLAGKLIMEEKKMMHGEIIDMTKFNAGTYFFSVTSQSMHRTYSIVKR